MRFCKTLVTCGLTAAVLVAPLTQRSAVAQQPPQDVAVVSIGPLDSTLRDTTYLLRACNAPEFGGIVSFMGQQYTQGLDKTKPLGARVTLNGGVPDAVLFMPMVDRSLFFDALAGMGIEPDDLGDGLFEIDTGAQTIFAKETNGWMFVGQTEGSLTDLPADPAAMLGKLPSNYDLAIRINARNVPQEMKDQAIEQIRIGFERGMAEQSGQTEEEQALAKEMGEASVEQFTRLINDTDQMIFGWSISSEDRRTFMDGGVQFKADSELAEQANAAQDVTSDYTAFILPQASAKFRFTSEIAESDREVAKGNFRNSMAQAKSQLEQQGDLPAEAEEMLVELMDGLAKVMEQTIDEGLFDGAGSVSVADNTLRVLMGGRIADGNALAAEFKKAAEKIPSGESSPTFEFDYGNYKGYTLHRVTVPVKIADPGAREAFGEELQLVIGTAEKSYFMALDPAGDAIAKQVIDAMEASKGSKVSPFEGVVAFNDLLKFAQSVSPNSILDNVVSVMSEYGDNDKVEVTTRLIDRGAIYRLSIDEGVLKSVGTAARSGGDQGGF